MTRASLSEPRSRFVDVGGGVRHVVEWGEPGAPMLWLQHGLRDHARSWDWTAARFQDRCHVVAADLRGHGDSATVSPGAYTLADYVVDLGELVEALGPDRIDLVGHSLGGHIALRFAAVFPERVRRLCVIEGIELPIVRDQRARPRPYPERLRRWIDDARGLRGRTPRFFPALADATARMAAANPKIDAATISHLTRHGVRIVAGGGLRWKYDEAVRSRAPDDPHGLDLDDILAAIDCPTLLAYGEESWIPLPPADRLARLRDHELIRFAHASHWLHHQAREWFLAALADFLARPDPSTPESEQDA